jgi:hypothetical protein
MKNYNKIFLNNMSNNNSNQRNTAAAEPTSSALVIQKSSLGYDIESVPAILHPHNLCLYDPAYYSIVISISIPN